MADKLPVIFFTFYFLLFFFFFFFFFFWLNFARHRSTRRAPQVARAPPFAERWYRYFKHTLVLETYLLDLDNSSRFILTKFRCRNIKLPNNLYRFSVDDEDRVCKLCADGSIGDEKHYLLDCNFFASKRNILVSPHLPRQYNDSKMFELLMNSSNITVLTNLCKFIKILYSKFST